VLQQQQSHGVVGVVLVVDIVLVVSAGDPSLGWLHHDAGRPG
jgi:hypothetical protein